MHPMNLIHSNFEIFGDVIVRSYLQDYELSQLVFFDHATAQGVYQTYRDLIIQI